MRQSSFTVQVEDCGDAILELEGRLLPRMQRNRGHRPSPLLRLTLPGIVDHDVAHDSGTQGKKVSLIVNGEGRLVEELQVGFVHEALVSRV